MRLPALLTLTLFSIFLQLSAREEPVQVIGLINQSVRLSGDSNRMDPILSVEWWFQSKEQSIRITEFRNSQFNVDTFTDQFNNRLNHSDSMKGLIIRDLRADDSGLYERRIMLKNGTENRTGYNLTVYDLVPAPEIQTELQIKSSDWCNFTLHCSVTTNTAALSVSWKYRHTDTEYTPFNQTVDNNGHTVRLSLTPRSHDKHFLCLVQNPVDQKNVSVSAREICTGNKQSGDGKTGERHRILLPVLLTIIFLILTAAIVIIWKKREGKEGPEAARSTCSPIHSSISVVVIDRMIEAVKICLYALVLHVWGDRTDQHSLNGLLQQSINLTNRLDFIQTVKEVSWYFESFGGKKLRICQCGNTISKPCGSEHFELHSDCMILLIKNLTRADSGLYETHFILQDETTERASFNLTVYDPVPTPTISILGSVNANACNLTLHCSVTANVSALHYTWRSRSLAEEEVYSNVSTMELSLNPKAWDNEYQCVVHNHASQNMASFIPRHTCLNLDNGHDRHNYYIILSLLVIVLPVSIWFAVVLNKAVKKEQDSAPGEVTYCEVGESKADDMDCYQNIAQDTNVPMMTVYSLLQRDEK